MSLKLDGYRALAIRTGGNVQLRSRNDNDFSARYPGIVKALAAMPHETVIDGEVVALDEEGRPSFNTLQNHGSAAAPVHFFIFDLLILKGRNVMDEPLMERRRLLEKHVFPAMAEPIRYSPMLDGSLKELTRSVIYAEARLVSTPARVFSERLKYRSAGNLARRPGPANGSCSLLADLTKNRILSTIGTRNEGFLTRKDNAFDNLIPLRSRASRASRLNWHV